MTLSIGGFAKTASLPFARLPTSGPAFGDMFSNVAVSTTSSSGDHADISAAARALSDRASTSGNAIDEAEYHRIMTLPKAEMAAELTRQADAISASQGLPPGKFDYTQISVGQMMVVRSHLIVNGGQSAESLAPMLMLGLQNPDGGTSYGTPIDWTAPRNLASEMKRDRDALVSVNNDVVARLYDQALLAMKNSSVLDAHNASYYFLD